MTAEPGGRERPSRAVLEGPPGTRDVARGAGAALLGRAGAIFEIVAQPAYVWMFGLASYGLYTILWSAVNLVENVADLGMTTALQRTVPQAGTEEEAVAALRAALLLGVVPSLLIAALASAGAGWIAGFVNVAAADRPGLAGGIALFAWTLPLWALVEVGTSALRARRAFGPEIRLRVFWEQVIRLGLAVPLWAAGLGIRALLIAHLLSLAVTAALTLRLIARYYDLRLLRRAPGAAGDTLLAGLSVLPSNIVARLFGDAPPLILNFWFPGAAGANAAGLYGIARKLSSLVQTVRIAMSYVVGPLASAAARHDRAGIEPLFAFATRLGTALAVPIAAMVIAAGPALLSLSGPAKQTAAAVLVPLVLARLVDAITGPGGAVQQATSARSHALVGSLIGLVVALGVGAALIESAGVGGIALAVAAGLSATSVTTVAMLRVHDGLNPFRAPYLRVLAASVLISASLGAGVDAAPAPPGWRVALMAAALLASLWLCLRFALPADDRRALGRTGARLRLSPGD